tara:strand:- start:3802 stop:4479 length:678 start_codon:yes stop_codon:yes gene_type:complete
MVIINIILFIIIILVIFLLIKFLIFSKELSLNLKKSIFNDNDNTKLEFYSNIDKNPKIKKSNIYFLIKIDDDNNIYKLVFKLFDDIVPITCKNFRILSTKGIKQKSYKNSRFHRVIKNFMIQGGDIINGNGTGTMSIYGNKFNDENFKIPHNEEGLLSMANSGPNTNGSQFFITTNKASHLDNKHVVFGKVIEGIDVIRKIENLKTDDNDKPYSNIKIIDCGEVK